MGSYVPNTKEQRQEMLKEIGFQTIDDFWDSSAYFMPSRFCAASLTASRSSEATVVL